jgi:hypothetical protein
MGFCCAGRLRHIKTTTPPAPLSASGGVVSAKPCPKCGSRRAGLPIGQERQTPCVSVVRKM